MLRKKRRWVIVAFIVVLIIVVVVFNRGGDLLSVDVVAVERGTVEATVANTRAGTIKACRRAKLAPPGGGQIAHLLVKEGQSVKEGDLLLELWNDDLVAQVKLSANEALAARQSADQECLLSDNAKREADRQVRMQKDKLVADEQAENSVANSSARRLACNAAKTRAVVAEARMESVKAALEKTRLRAPFNGRVAEVNGEVGEFVTPSPPGILTPPAVDIVDTSCLFVAAPIDEVDAPRIVEGMEARLTLDAFPNEVFLGAVRRIAPYVLEVEKQARTVEIEAVFMNEKQYEKLLPGYSADIEVILDAKLEVLRVPTEAIFKGDKVLVVDEKTDLLEERSVKAGLANWKFTEIVDGLREHELVTVSLDREGVKAGAHIKPVLMATRR